MEKKIIRKSRSLTLGKPIALVCLCRKPRIKFCSDLNHLANGINPKGEFEGLNSKLNIQSVFIESSRGHYGYSAHSCNIQQHNNT